MPDQAIEVSFVVHVPPGWNDNQIEELEGELTAAAEEAAKSVTDKYDDMGPARGFDTDIITI